METMIDLADGVARAAAARREYDEWERKQSAVWTAHMRATMDRGGTADTAPPQDLQEHVAKKKNALQLALRRIYDDFAAAIEAEQRERFAERAQQYGALVDAVATDRDFDLRVRGLAAACGVPAPKAIAPEGFDVVAYQLWRARVTRQLDPPQPKRSMVRRALGALQLVD